MIVSRVAGVDASLRWGYHHAAALKHWQVDRDEGAPTWTLTATIVTADTFRLSQQPLVFQAPHRLGCWRWPIDTLQTSGGTLTARLGPRME